ncbi:hypothetical protein B0T26DRAFT_658736 [Lasiosphaeria miniovina]|uniref:Uncharacterized protein n=1 Tax=Lasiosphaeria miniovina TaxID=1954250 RepID=A0AA39ZUB5_9PEZI|nr:uncharacterized protein B0T26DRAFT_658736 [Lasiosphaeria miniovina]KAK0703752.1 hypothetical protein B0T26DRAFT_658736 [Lasiosphaeria miniovina]
MPTDTTLSNAGSSTTTSPKETGSTRDDASGIGSNRTLVITLSSVLSVVGALMIVAAVLICWRYWQRRRLHFFARGISPIDDDEIATWKVPRSEKVEYPGGDTDGEAAAAAGGTTAAAAAGTGSGHRESGSPSHGKHASTSSAKKPPSVIVYSNALGQGYRVSSDEGSPRSFVHNSTRVSYTGGRKLSLDKALPQTPIQARAPNARAGLTDEAIPGDEPFLPSPKRQTSRLSKLPPTFLSQHRRAASHHHHLRTRSSRSSTRSFAGYERSAAGSDMELSPRHSHDAYPTHSGHSRVYSSSSIPPRLSFGDEGVFGGSLSSPSASRPWFRDEFHGDNIGRAIG